MSLVLVSLLALLSGPLVVQLARGRGWVLSLIDGFVVVTIGGIVLLHILPHAFLVGGAATLVVAAIGLVGPTLLESTLGARVRAVAGLVLPVALLGLAIHAMLDGVVLAEGHHDGAHGGEGHGSGEFLALGVVLHRIPEGLAIWWIFQRERGRAAAGAALLFVAAATAAGFFLGEALESTGALGALHWIQALVAGSLLHVILHPSHSLASETAVVDDQASFLGREAPMRAAAAGALGGVGLLLAVSLSHPDSRQIASEIGMGATFVTLALESAPALLASYLIVGLWRSLWPGSAGRLGAGWRLVGAPALDLTALAVSLPLLGLRVTVARALGAIGVALAVGFVVRSLTPPEPAPSGLLDGSLARRAPAAERLRRGFVQATRGAVDRGLPWVLLGLGVASFAEPSLHAAQLPGAGSWFEVPSLALLGAPFYLYAPGATPLVAVLLHKGLSAGGAVAFLLTGPVLHGAAFRSLRGAAGQRVAWAFVAATLAAATGLGFLINRLAPQATPVALHEAADRAPGLLNLLSLAALTLLALGSLVRQGPRRWVEQISGGHDHAGHDHAGHDHAARSTHDPAPAGEPREVGDPGAPGG
jgi:hypothetical protein